MSNLKGFGAGALSIFKKKRAENAQVGMQPATEPLRPNLVPKAIQGTQQGFMANVPETIQAPKVQFGDPNVKAEWEKQTDTQKAIQEQDFATQNQVLAKQAAQAQRQSAAFGAGRGYNPFGAASGAQFANTQGQIADKGVQLALLQNQARSQLLGDVAQKKYGIDFQGNQLGSALVQGAQSQAGQMDYLAQAGSQQADLERMRLIAGGVGEGGGAGTGTSAPTTTAAGPGLTSNIAGAVAGTKFGSTALKAGDQAMKNIKAPITNINSAVNSLAAKQAAALPAARPNATNEELASTLPVKALEALGKMPAINTQTPEARTAVTEFVANAARQGTKVSYEDIYNMLLDKGLTQELDVWGKARLRFL